MKINKIGSSLIEALVVIVVLAMGVVGVYSFFAKSIGFLDGLNSRIEAIEIAREGIEALENIRNTNWLIFPVNKDNCWNVLNYNKNCILDNKTTKIVGDIYTIKTYILKNSSGRWELGSETDGSFSQEDFRKNFAVGKDKNTGRYCQPINTTTNPNCEKMLGHYTRKIQATNIGKDKMIIKTTVEWIDSSTSSSRKVEITNLLTNYKE